MVEEIVKEVLCVNCKKPTILGQRVYKSEDKSDMEVWCQSCWKICHAEEHHSDIQPRYVLKEVYKDGVTFACVSSESWWVVGVEEMVFQARVVEVIVNLLKANEFRPDTIRTMFRDFDWDMTKKILMGK
jgi:hypothetical protein